MKNKILVLGFVFVFLLAPYAHSQEIEKKDLKQVTKSGRFPNEKTLRSIIESINKNSIHGVLSNTGYQSSICMTFSWFLSAMLTKIGMVVYGIEFKQHYVIGLNVIKDDGKIEEYIIDPTYRQFFNFNLYEKGYTWKEFPLVYEKYNMPEILIVASKDYKALMDSFKLEPIWKNKNIKMLGLMFWNDQNRYTYDSIFTLVRINSINGSAPEK